MNTKTFSEYVQLREMAAGRSTTRMMTKATDPKMASVLISACRQGRPYYKHSGISVDEEKIPKRHKDNHRMVGRRVRTAMDDLETDLRTQGWGITKTFGGYPEDTPEGVPKSDVHEPSFLATKTTDDSPNKIIKSMVDLARDYDQDGVIIKLPGDTEGHEYKPKDKISVPYGTPQMQKDSDYYTRLRKGQNAQDRKLVYTGAYSKGTHPFDPNNPSPPEE